MSEFTSADRSPLGWAVAPPGPSLMVHEALSQVSTVPYSTFEGEDRQYGIGHKCEQQREGKPDRRCAPARRSPAAHLELRAGQPRCEDRAVRAGPADRQRVLPP